MTDAKVHTTLTVVASGIVAIAMIFTIETNFEIGLGMIIGFVTGVLWFWTPGFLTSMYHDEHRIGFAESLFLVMVGVSLAGLQWMAKWKGYDDLEARLKAWEQTRET